MEEVKVMVADESHIKYIDTILTTIQKDSSSVRSAKVTGRYPNWVFIFITAEPDVKEKIFA